MKLTHLSNALRRASPLLSHMTRAMTLATFVERKDIGPTNVQTRLASQQSLVPTPPNPMDDLWDLIAILDTEIHAGTTDTTKKDGENSKQTNTDGNIFLQQTQSPPSLAMDIPFIGAPSACHMTEFNQPLQVQSHLEMPGILVQLGHIQCT